VKAIVYAAEKDVLQACATIEKSRGNDA